MPDDEFDVSTIFEGLNRRQAETLRGRIPETIKQLRAEIEREARGESEPQEEQIKMSDDVLSNLSDDEREELQTVITGTLDGFKQKRQQAGQDGLRAQYDAELQKIMQMNIDSHARIRHMTTLKRKYRARGLNIW